MTTKTKSDTEKAFGGFDTANLDPNQMADNLRSYTEKGIEQSRENYARMKDMAEEATKTLETTFEKAQSGSKEFGQKSVDAMRESADNSFALVEDMFKVKTMSEMIELQTSYMRKQAELFAEQAKDMQSLVQKVGENVSKPAKEAFEKAAKKTANS